MNDLAQRIAQLSPEKLELLLRQAGKEAGGGELPAIPRRPEGLSPLPPSFAQSRFWFLERFDPGSPLYAQHAAFRLAGPLRAAALAAALGGIVRRHEALRSTFQAEWGEPVVRIGPPRPVPLPEVDLSALPEAARRAEGERCLREEARRPFDLARGPLLRALLLRLGRPEEGEHLVSVALHHIVSDGWSIALFAREVAQLYAAHVEGRPAALPELPIQYPDYALWQRGWLRGEVLAEQLAFWKDRLAGAPALLDLPLDRPRPAVRTVRGAQEPYRLSPGLAAGLRRAASAGSATLYMVLLATFQALLARCSGQEDVLVGSPDAGRDRVETEGLIGLFVNTLVRRAQVPGGASFRDLLAQVRESTLAEDAHRHLPFDKLVEALQPDRSPSHTLLFQVWFVLHNTPLPTVSLAGLTLSPLEVHGGTAKFDLTLSALEGNDGIEGALEYNADLFDPATVRRLLGYWEALCAGLAADPDAPVAAVPLLGEAEHWQATREGAPAGGTEGRRFEEALRAQARDRPAATALLCGYESVSYGELESRTNRLARHLRSLGVGSEVPVALCVERSADLLVGLLGIWKAGGACLPLDPRQPPDRLGFALEESATGVVVTQQSLLFDLPPAAVAAQIVCLDSDAYEIETQPEEPLGDPLPGEGLAWVIYTSGSTGRPKGVGVPRAAAEEHFATAARFYGLGPEDRVLQFAQLYFDAALEQVFPPLMSGATLVVRGEAVWSGADLDRALRENGVTVGNLPTGYWQQWLAEAGGTRGTARGPGGGPLRLMIAGGDVLGAEAARAWGRLFPGVRLLNAYGPTEGVITATVHEVDPAHVPARVPIGRPLPGRGGYVLDRQGNPAPLGSAGELHLPEPFLARGYLARPELTAASFVPDPFAGRPGARMYRTGDRVRRRLDGELELLGRLDHQVKVRGFRIELGEVEEALRRHPGVRSAVAAVRGDGSEGKRIVAYAVPADGAAPAEEELRAHLQDALPVYMVPSRIVLLAALPLSGTGKVDRAALPDPAQERSPLEATEAAARPRTPVEKALGEIWTEVLGVEAAGLDDDFFALGGHSLLGMQVLARVEEVLRVDVPLQALFAAPTLAGLAEQVELALAEETVAAPPVAPAPRDRPLPLSFAQQRLWFHEQLDPGTALYVMPAGVRLAGRLDVAALARSFAEVVRRHEALRTTFALDGETPVQVIAVSDAPPPLPVVDLEALPASARDAEIQRLQAAEARRPFDLVRGPLLRTTLLRSGPGEHLLMLTFHHIVSDGWSMGVLVREVAAVYEAFAGGRPSPLPPLSLQYADFACWQRQWLQGEVLERQLDYWRRQLEGAPAALDLPTDRPRAASPAHRGTFLELALSPELSRAARALARGADCTLFMTLLAAFETLLLRYSGQEDFVLGTSVANRGRSQAEQLIGFFVNALPLRADLRGNPPFRELLRRVRRSVLGAFAHQDVPFDRLVEDLRPGRDAARAPLFQAMFVLQNAPMPALELPGLTLTPRKPDGGVSRFDLTLEIVDAEPALTGILEYDTGLFDAATAERMLERFRLLLERVTADPGLRLLDIPLGGAVIAATAAFGEVDADKEFVFDLG